MNRSKMLALTAAAVLAFAIGCGKAGMTLDTRALEKRFASTEPAIRVAVDKAVAAAKAKDYGAVLAELAKLANYEKLTAEQKQTLDEMLERTRKLAASNPPKNVDQLPMALPK